METKKQVTDSASRSHILEGVIAAWPICVGYIPIGFAFGVLASKAGLSPLDIALMSVLVFAGSAQFIAVSMLSGGAGAAAIIVTTFMVNLRHLLMSSSLSVLLKNEDRRWLTAFAYGITDESFAVNLVQFNKGGWDLYRAVVLNQTANAVWVVSTVAGGFGGSFIGDTAFGIDYALTAMFICLLIFQLRGHRYVAVALISGATAVGLSMVSPGNGYIVAATVFSASVVVLFERRSGSGERGEDD